MKIYFLYVYVGQGLAPADRCFDGESKHSSYDVNACYMLQKEKTESVENFRFNLLLH